MTTVDVFDDYLDELYHTRDLAYDREDYDTVREINIQLSDALNVNIDDIDDLDDYDNYAQLIDEDEYVFEEID